MTTQTSRRLPLVFASTILIPGLILCVFGFRSLLQERQFAEQQISVRLASAAESAGRQLELELKEWQQAADGLAGSDDNPEHYPARVREALDRGTGVVLLSGHKSVRAIPPARLLYLLVASEVSSSTPDASFSQAETLELRDRQYDRAIELYRSLLASAKPAVRPRIFLGLARTLGKAGRADAALETYRLLEKEPAVRIGSLPSDLIASYEIVSMRHLIADDNSALRLFQQLVQGRWLLEKTSYLFYSETVRDWLPPTGEARELLAKEKQKMAITTAVERFVEAPRSLSADGETLSIAFWHSEPFAAIVLAQPAGSVFTPVCDTDVQCAVFRPGYKWIAGSTGAPTHDAAEYALQQSDWPLRVRSWPANADALYGQVRRRQTVYFAMLVMVGALLGFGGYLTLRTIRTDLAVAQMKSEFVSTVSHEFRSPLAGLSQLGEMLRDGRVRDEERRKEYYEMIVAETQRLRRLVENILDFSRMEDGRKQYHFEPLASADWLRDLAEEFQLEAAAKGFTLESRIPESLPAIVADRESLNTAVHNLLDNAVKYSRDSKTIQLDGSCDGNAILVSVRDRGVGIRAEDRPHIFERFYRGSGEIAREVKGVGLGLNLVQHIVAAHGGTIHFDSKEGEGSTFTIRLKTEGRMA